MKPEGPRSLTGLICSYCGEVVESVGVIPGHPGSSLHLMYSYSYILYIYVIERLFEFLI